MAAAMGSMGGEPSVTLRSSGKTAPTAAPHGAPHTKPHSSTGMCMGQSMAPNLGICPVKNGSSMPSAKNSAAQTKRCTRARTAELERVDMGQTSL